MQRDDFHKMHPLYLESLVPWRALLPDVLCSQFMAFVLYFAIAYNFCTNSETTITKKTVCIILKEGREAKRSDLS